MRSSSQPRVSKPSIFAIPCSLVADDRVTLPSDTTRKVKGVDVLPWVLSPLMGPEEIDMEVSESTIVVISPADMEKDMDLLPASLQLLGPEKVRERDHVLRLMCVEILLLLSSSAYRSIMPSSAC